MPTGDYPYNTYREYGNPVPYWQYLPDPYPHYYRPIPYGDECPMCGYKYVSYYTADTTADEAGWKIRYIDFTNHSRCLALAEPEEPRQGNYTLHFHIDIPVDEEEWVNAHVRYPGADKDDEDDNQDPGEGTDETQEEYYLESLDKGKPRRNYSH